MRRSWHFKLSAIALASAIPTSLNAQQQKYAVTDAGWHIYKENLSCAMYLDTSRGTMLRFSNRVDEERVYVLVVNEAWEMLRPRLNENIQGELEFTKIKKVHVSIAAITDTPDNRLGFSMGDIGRQDFLLHLAGEGELVFSVMAKDSNKMQEVERIDITGAYEAVGQLMDCTTEHF